MLWLGGEQAVQQVDCDGTLANGGGDPFTRAVANVAGGENGRHACLQKECTTFQRPCTARGKIGAAEDEALFISIDVGRQPFSTRACADHQKEPSRGHRFFAATPLLRKHEVVQPGVAATAHDFGAQPASGPSSTARITGASMWRTLAVAGRALGGTVLHRCPLHVVTRHRGRA